MKNLKEESVLEIIKQHFSEVPIIKRCSSESNYVAKLEFKESSKIIKINLSNITDKLQKELYVFEILKNYNIPAPKIEFMDLTAKRFPQYIIMEDLGEKCLTYLTKSKKLFTDMGSYFAKIHSIKFDKQGLILKNKIEPKSFYEHNQKLFDTKLKSLIKLKELSALEVEKSKQLFSKFQDSNEAVLCHMDFGPMQIIIDENEEKINGIIDWEWAISSNSISDFAKSEMIFSLFGGDFKSLRLGYEKVKPLPGNYNEIKKPYILVHIFCMIEHFKITNNKPVLQICKDYFKQLIF